MYIKMQSHLYFSSYKLPSMLTILEGDVSDNPRKSTLDFCSFSSAGKENHKLTFSNIVLLVPLVFLQNYCLFILYKHTCTKFFYPLSSLQPPFHHYTCIQVNQCRHHCTSLTMTIIHLNIFQQ